MNFIIVSPRPRDKQHDFVPWLIDELHDFFLATNCWISWVFTWHIDKCRRGGPATDQQFLRYLSTTYWWILRGFSVIYWWILQFFCNQSTIYADFSPELIQEFCDCFHMIDKIHNIFQLHIVNFAGFILGTECLISVQVFHAFLVKLVQFFPAIIYEFLDFFSPPMIEWWISRFLCTGIWQFLLFLRAIDWWNSQFSPVSWLK